MAEVVKSIDIDAPVEVVFDYVANPYNVINFTPQFTRFAPLGQPERGLGARVEAAGNFLGMHFETQLEIVEFEENKKIISRSTSGVKSLSSWYFKPLASGGTEVTFISDYVLPGRMLGWMLDKMLMQKDVEKNTIQTLVNLKKILEGKPNLRVANYAAR